VDRYWRLTYGPAVEDSTSSSAKAAAAKPTKKRLPAKLTVREAAALCQQIAEREAERLPQTSEEEKISRLRFPRNNTDKLFRDGLPADRVVLDAATRVLEQWVHVLRRLVPHDSLEELLAETVHAKPESPAHFVNTSASDAFSRAATPKRLIVSPNPTPLPITPLGAALRRLVPLPEAVGQRPWEFLEDLLDAVALEERFEYASPVHSLRPDTAVRQQWSTAMKSEAAFSKHWEAPFLLAKNRMLQEGANDRRATLSTAAKLRLSGGGQSWATFNATDRCRKTCCAWSPQVFMSGQGAEGVPGPGAYRKPMSSCATRRRGGEYPRVGNGRCIGSETLELRDRWMPPKPH